MKKVNPTKTEIKKGKSKLESLLTSLKKFDIKPADLAKNASYDYKENTEAFKLIYEIAKLIKINSFKVKKTEKLNDPVYSIQVSLNYDCKINEKVIDKGIKKIIDIRISNDKGIQFPTLLFISELYNYALETYKNNHRNDPK